MWPLTLKPVTVLNMLFIWGNFLLGIFQNFSFPLISVKLLSIIIIIKALLMNSDSWSGYLVTAVWIWAPAEPQYERERGSASKPFLSLFFSQSHFSNAKSGHPLTTQAEWPIQDLFQVFQTSSSLVTVGCLLLCSGFQGSKNPKAQWCLCFTCVLSLILPMSEPSIKGF